MRRLAGLCAIVAAAFLSMTARAETIRIGTTGSVAAAPAVIAAAKGYFTAVGLDARIVFFPAALPIAPGVLSGDLEFGSTGLTASFYNLASGGALRIVAASTRDAPGFRQYAFVVANRAASNGLKSYADLPGHSVALAEIGGPTHYSLSLIARKHGLDLRSIRLLPMQSNANVVSAVVGGQADAATLVATAVTPALAHGDVTLLGYTGDEQAWQGGAVFTTARIADTRRDLVERFLAALRRGAQDYHDAFIATDGTRRDGPTAPAMLALVAQGIGQPIAAVAGSLPFIDAGLRLDIADVQRQIDWYRSQGMVRGAVDGATLVDRRYVTPLPPSGR